MSMTLSMTLTGGEDGEQSFNVTAPPKVVAMNLRATADQIDPPTPRRRSRGVRGGIEADATTAPAKAAPARRSAVSAE